VLYQLRDPLVHHELALRESVAHPNGLTNVSQEMADYSLENLGQSLDLAFDVATTAMTHPRLPQVADWANPMAHVAEKLQQLRPIAP
jgi:hypothetical protein